MGRSTGNNTNNERRRLRPLKNPNEIRSSLQDWRKFTPSQVETLFDMMNNKKSAKLDKITQFGLRPPELCSLFDMVGKFYRWFEVGNKPLKDEKISEILDENIYFSP